MDSYFQQVSSDYRHTTKKVIPQPALQTPQVYFKWYCIHPEALEITGHDVLEAQHHLRTELGSNSLELNDEVGFVIQHRTAEWMILYVCTWRGNNEIWETLYHRQLATESNFKRFKRSDTSPTFCVWVMAAVSHEQKAWSRFLQSERRDEDQSAYLSDQLTDLVC